MKDKKLLIIGLFALLNFGFGYLFQLSRGVICFLELTVLLISGISFWILAIKPIEKLTITLVTTKRTQTKQIVSFAGFGIGTILLNLFFAQLVILLVMWFFLRINTPASNTLINSLTNNLAGNLFCFTALVGLTAYEHKNRTSKTKLPNANPVSNGNLQYILINKGRSLFKVNYSDIVYIQSSRNCITLVTIDKKFVKYQSLKSFLTECSYHKFKRIHRSCAVNTNFVSHVRLNDNGDGKVYMKDKQELKLSRTFKKEIIIA